MKIKVNNYLNLNLGNKVLKFKVSTHAKIPAVSKTPFNVMVKFKNNTTSEWMSYWVPKEFYTITGIIAYFMDNQDSTYVKVKVLDFKEVKRNSK